MKPHPKPVLFDAEQALPETVSLRLIERAERARYDQLLVTHHYLHSADLVGEQLRYVAEHDGQWVAVADLECCGLQSQAPRGVDRVAPAPEASAVIAGGQQQSVCDLVVGRSGAQSRQSADAGCAWNG